MLIILIVLTVLNIAVAILNFLSSVNYHARLEEIQKELKRIGEFFG